jgi:glycerol-3-phosphate acyltransferase PlsY
VVAVLFGYLILGWNEFGYNESGQFIYAYDQVGAAIAGLFVMLGHMFPVFYKFKGGKGVATSMAVIACIDPVFTFSICGITYFAVLLGTRYVSLASCMTLILYPVFLSSVCTALGGVNPTACALAVIMAVLVVFMHRENIKRLLAGNERKVSFKKKKKNPDGTVEDATSVDAPAAEAPAETKSNHGNKKNKSKKK